MPSRKANRQALNKGTEPRFLERKDGVEVSVYADDQGTAELRSHVGVDPMSRTRNGKKPARTLDALDNLIRHKVITPAEFRVGREYQSVYHASRLDPLQAPNLGRTPGQASGDMAEKIYVARSRIADAHKRVGHGVAEQVLTGVLGEGKTLKEWAEIYRLVKRTNVDRKQASAFLRMALGVLAENW